MGAAFEVAVLGGGPAGLAAATTLARSRRRVVLIDDGTPRNAAAPGVHGHLGCDGMAPADLAARGRDQLARYGAALHRGAMVGAGGSIGTGFTVSTVEAELTARRVIVATGVTDRLPDLPGLADRFGRDVLHCPYCHGWEVRDRRIGLLATGTWSAHLAQLLRQLSGDVVLFVGPGTQPSAEQAAGLAARDIRVVSTAVVGLDVVGDRLTAVLLADGTEVSVDVLFCSPVMTARTDGLAGLGLPVTVDPRGFGTVLSADDAGRTPVPGVWAAGNVRNLQAQVSTSAADGAAVGAAVNAELVNEDVRAALAAVSSRRTPG